jgi:hypothetical protein
MENNQFPTFENFREETKANEAMVQVAGKSKPSGATVLATVIVDYMINNNLINTGAIDVKNRISRKELVDTVKDIIMDSTF